MILDRLQHAPLYRPLNPGIAAALDYLRATDFSRVAPGRYELDGQRLVAIVQRYRSKPLAEAAWEAHRRYADVQYVAEGTERMGWCPLTAELPLQKPYDDEKDVVFYDTGGDLFEVSAGSFVVFLPHDVHAPGLAVRAAADVLKVVVKVAWDS